MITEAHRAKHKRHYKRWLRKHPEYVIKSLKRWVSREKDPTKKAEAEYLLKTHLERYQKLTGKVASND